MYNWNVLPLTLLCNQTVTSINTSEMDFTFMKYLWCMKTLLTIMYNTQYTSDSGLSRKPGSKLIYLPLVDKIQLLNLRSKQGKKLACLLQISCYTEAWYWFMSFVGSVGTLMYNSSLKEYFRHDRRKKCFLWLYEHWDTLFWIFWRITLMMTTGSVLDHLSKKSVTTKY